MKRAAPARLRAAATAQATDGGERWGAGRPVVTAATSRRMAMPSAVPSWAAVLMMPEAAPRAAAGTLVPRPVAATEARPIPAPPTALQAGRPHGLPAAVISAVSDRAM